MKIPLGVPTGILKVTTIISPGDPKGMPFRFHMRIPSDVNTGNALEVATEIPSKVNTRILRGINASILPRVPMRFPRGVNRGVPEVSTGIPQ